MGKTKKQQASLVGLFKANKVFIKELFKTGKCFIIFQIAIYILIIPINYWVTYAPKNFIDSITQDNNLYIALSWIILMVILKYAERIMMFAQDFMKKRAFSNAKLKSKNVLYQKIQLIYLSYFEDSNNLDIFNKCLSYNETGGERLVNSTISFIRAIITLGTMTYISFQFDWWIWIAVLVVVVFEYFSDKYLKKLGFSFSMDKIKRDREQNYYNGLPTNKNSIADIKLNSSMFFFFEKYRSAFIKNRTHSEKYEIKANLFALLFSIPNEILFCLCYLLIGIWLLNGKASIGDYTLFFSMITSITSQLKVIITSINSFYEQSLSAKVFNDFVENTDIFINDNIANSNKVPDIQSITFQNVSFNYPGRPEKALDNITLSIRKGEKISIVGFNGAGKTTFLKLLTLLYHPVDGTIKINRNDYQNIDIHDYWEKIGIVFQSHQVYAMSIKDNILLRDATPNDDEIIWKVLNDVGLSEKIKNQDEGLDLQLTRNFDPKGMDFSGGEKQRLSIAKVLAKDSDIYVFDEPSSALDSVAEDALYQSIAKIPKDKTVIMISHRLSSVFFTDRIIFFDNGHIIADGTHDNLMENCPKYREIYRLQADKYK